jgi:hypothetical protein
MSVFISGDLKIIGGFFSGSSWWVEVRTKTWEFDVFGGAEWSIFNGTMREIVYVNVRGWIKTKWMCECSRREGNIGDPRRPPESRKGETSQFGRQGTPAKMRKRELLRSDLQCKAKQKLLF